jgi:hypothetical protein
MMASSKKISYLMNYLGVVQIMRDHADNLSFKNFKAVLKARVRRYSKGSKVKIPISSKMKKL